MNLVTEIQYFPPVSFYKNLNGYSHIIFEQYETYQKMSFRNRTLVAGANGIISLSIPLEKGRDQKMRIKEVRIDKRKNWQAQHWKSIESSYNRSPWFDHYREDLIALFQKRVSHLFDWNIICFEWTMEKLGLNSGISFSENYQVQYDPGSHIDRRNQILPKNYFQYPVVKYRQVFEERLGFLPNLSVLDLLFCEGRNAGMLLTG